MGETPKVNKAGAVAAIFVGLIILFFVFCFRVVGVGQVGLVTRFGKVVREQGSGAIIKMPFPIEHLTKLNVQVQKEQVDATASTADLQDVTTTLALNYHLDPKNAREVYTDIGAEYKIRVIDPAIQEAFKATSAKFTAQELLNKRPEVKEHSLEVIKSRLEHRHIIVDDISIVNFKFSAEFTQAIESKQVAQQQAEQAKFAALKAEIDAQAAINTAKGESESQRLIQASITPEVLQQQAIKRWNGVMPNAIGGNTIFNIPLTK